jgi:hypothetical protein
MQLANQKGWALFTMRRTGRNIRALAASVNYARAFHNIRAAVRTTLSRPALQPVLASARGSHERERGQTLIEFAFALPIILLFLMVMVDFGLALDHRIVLQHAVRDGVREAAFNSNLTQIKDTTADQSQGMVGTEDVEVC